MSYSYTKVYKTTSLVDQKHPNEIKLFLNNGEIVKVYLSIFIQEIIINYSIIFQLFIYIYSMLF
jgi:hypothetical protein